MAPRPTTPYRDQLVDQRVESPRARNEASFANFVDAPRGPAGGRSIRDGIETNEMWSGRELKMCGFSGNAVDAENGNADALSDPGRRP